MKIVIVGAGIAGLTFAILIKQFNRDNEVIVLEKNNEILKKIKVSGNGRCNIANKIILPDKYNNKEVFNNVFTDNNIKSFFEFIKNDLDIILTSINDYLYPNSLSSNSVIYAYNNLISKLDIKIKLNCEFLDALKENNNFKIKTNIESFNSDFLIISSGSNTYYNNYTNYVFDYLKKNKITYSDFKGSLTGFLLKENVERLDGVRIKCEVSLKDNQNNCLFNEKGEVNFKKDGISGIVIMNASSEYNWHNLNSAKLSLNIFPENAEKQIFSKDSLHINYSEKLANYLLNRYKSNIDYSILSNVEFNIKSTYNSSLSQVAHGGVNFFELNNDFTLKKDNRIYILGELTNMDGMCGGYNIMYCILTGIIAGRSFNERIK